MLRLLSFDVLRTLDLPGVVHLNPGEWLTRRREVLAADWVLFPEYWQVNTLVYGWRRPIFPSPASYHLGHDKVEMTRAFQASCPEHTPHTLILPATPAGIEQVLDEMSFPFVAKSVRSSMGAGVWRIDDRAAFLDYAARHPVLYVQEHLPIERDLRIVYVGDRVVTAYWRVAANGGFHNNVARGARVCFEAVAPEAVDLVTELAAGLGIDHAGFDVAVVDGHCFLLEFNVRFGTDALNRRGIRLGPSILAHLRARSATAPVSQAG